MGTITPCPKVEATVKKPKRLRKAADAVILRRIQFSFKVSALLENALLPKERA